MRPFTPLRFFCYMALLALNIALLCLSDTHKLFTSAGPIIEGISIVAVAVVGATLIFKAVTYNHGPNRTHEVVAFAYLLVMDLSAAILLSVRAGAGALCIGSFTELCVLNPYAVASLTLAWVAAIIAATGALIAYLGPVPGLNKVVPRHEVKPIEKSNNFPLYRLKFPSAPESEEDVEKYPGFDEVVLSPNRKVL